MIVLDETLDDIGGAGQDGGIEILLGVEPAQVLVVDEQDAIEQAVFTHEIFSRGDLLGRFVLSSFLLLH